MKTAAVQQNVNPFEFEVITTFESDDMEQSFLDVKVDAMPDEDTFVDWILSDLTEHELHNLCKLSVCQIRRKQDDTISRAQRKTTRVSNASSSIHCAQ